MGQTAVGETRTGTVTTYLRAVGLFSLDVRLFLLSSALIGLCWKGIYAVLYNLYLLRLGYGPGFIGLANAVPTLTYGIACLPAGLIGDRWGARRAMIAGAAIVVIGLALPPCAEWLPVPLRGGWLLLSYAVAWVGAALNIVNANPYLMVATGTEERDHAFSVQMALWPMAGFAGSLLGGLLPGFFASTLGLGLESPAAYRYPLFVAAGLYIPAIPLLLATRGPLASAPGAAREEDGRAPWALIALVFIVVLLYVAGDGVVRTFYNVYLDRELGLSTPAIGSLYGVALLVATLAALAAPIVMARWGRWGELRRSDPGDGSQPAAPRTRAELAGRWRRNRRHDRARADRASDHYGLPDGTRRPALARNDICCWHDGTCPELDSRFLDGRLPGRHPGLPRVVPGRSGADHRWIGRLLGVRAREGSLDGDSLADHYGCLGSGPTAMKHQPLAVQIERAPDDVHVVCSMAR